MNTEFMGRAEKLTEAPYTIRITLDETVSGKPVYVAEALELDGCLGQGPTSEKAREDLRLAMVDYIYSLLEDGLPVPGPASYLTYTTTCAVTCRFENRPASVRAKESLVQYHTSPSEPDCQPVQGRQ